MHIAFFGTLTGCTPAGVLTVDLEHITFNALAPAPNVGGNGQPSSSSTPKCCRFDFCSSPSVAPAPLNLAPPTVSSSGSLSQDGGPAVTYGTIVQTFAPLFPVLMVLLTLAHSYPLPEVPNVTSAATEPVNAAALGTTSNTGRMRGEKCKGPAAM